MIIDDNSPNSPRNRYHRDPMFRQLVDTLYLQIEHANYTPTELREAAILAAIMHAERQPPAPFIVPRQYDSSWMDEPPTPTRKP